MTETKTEGKTALAKADEYQPTPHEQKLLEAHAARQGEGPRRLRIVGEGGTYTTTVQHPEQAIGWLLLGEAMGTSGLLETDRLVNDAVNLSGRTGKPADEHSANHILSIIKGIAPKDTVELMLATQMAAIHRATIDAARSFNFTETLQQQDVAERTLNKLARTFTTQVEALKRYRSKGEQSVEVKHVHVHEGGQAIVGNVTGGGAPKKQEQTA